MNNLNEIGKLLIVAGIILLVTGIVIIFWNKIPFLGKLPGDIVIKNKSFVFYFPLATSVLLSIIISLILYIFRNK